MTRPEEPLAAPIDPNPNPTHLVITRLPQPPPLLLAAPLGERTLPSWTTPQGVHAEPGDAAQTTWARQCPGHLHALELLGHSQDHCRGQ